MLDFFYAINLAAFIIESKRFNVLVLMLEDLFYKAAFTASTVFLELPIKISLSITNTGRLKNV